MSFAAGLAQVPGSRIGLNGRFQKTPLAMLSRTENVMAESVRGHVADGHNAYEVMATAGLTQKTAAPLVVTDDEYADFPMFLNRGNQGPSALDLQFPTLGDKSASLDFPRSTQPGAAGLSADDLEFFNRPLPEALQPGAGVPVSLQLSGIGAGDVSTAFVNLSGASFDGRPIENGAPLMVSHRGLPSASTPETMASMARLAADLSDPTHPFFAKNIRLAAAFRTLSANLETQQHDRAEQPADVAKPEMPNAGRYDKSEGEK
ncbi:MAG: hypothetical protein ABH823_02595 [bacterium]